MAESPPRKLRRGRSDHDSGIANIVLLSECLAPNPDSRSSVRNWRHVDLLSSVPVP